jgi:SHS2 domain-containing protein
MFETFAHTADIGLRIRSTNLNTLFAEAGQAFFSLIVENLADVEPRTRAAFHVTGQDLAYLLADWLNELLYAFSTQRLLFSRFDVVVEPDGLRAVAQGETIDEARHLLDHEVKAVTYHGLKVEKLGDGWLAEVVLDI